MLSAAAGNAPQSFSVILNFPQSRCLAVPWSFSPAVSLARAPGVLSLSQAISGVLSHSQFLIVSWSNGPQSAVSKSARLLKNLPAKQKTTRNVGGARRFLWGGVATRLGRSCLAVPSSRGPAVSLARAPVFLRRSQPFSVNRAPHSHSQFLVVSWSRSLVV